MTLVVLSHTWVAVTRERTEGLTPRRETNSDLCDIGSVLYNWELIVLWLYDEPVLCRCILIYYSMNIWHSCSSVATAQAALKTSRRIYTERIKYFSSWAFTFLSISISSGTDDKCPIKPSLNLVQTSVFDSCFKNAEDINWLTFCAEVPLNP